MITGFQMVKATHGLHLPIETIRATFVCLFLEPKIIIMIHAAVIQLYKPLIEVQNMKKIKRYLGYIAITTSCGMASAPVYANSIGINFWRNYDPAETLPLSSADTAGVVAQNNWNNVGTALPDTGSPRTNTVPNLVDNTGTNSGATVFFTAGKIDAPAGHIDETQGPNYQLMEGYLDTRTTFKPSVTVSSVPYALYDIYVYYDSAATLTAGNQTGLYTLTYGSNSLAYFGNDTNEFSGNFIQGQSATYDSSHTNGDTGNYMIFSGISGASFTLAATGVSNTGAPNGAAAPINALQIKPVTVPPQAPEPGSIALISLGLAGMYLGKRRKSSVL